MSLLIKWEIYDQLSLDADSKRWRLPSIATMIPELVCTVGLLLDHLLDL
jgi:hypothetical protein